MATQISSPRGWQGFGLTINCPTWRRQHKACSFLSLPGELRQQIYGHYFAASCVRYGRQRRHLSTNGRRKEAAYCRGPAEIALILTNKLVYQEALLVLQASITLIFDRTGIYEALRQIYDHTHIPPTRTVPLLPNPIPPFLFDLISNARHMIVSKVGCHYPHLPIPELPHLETVTIFGFYPRLRDYLSHGDLVAPSQRYWHFEHASWWQFTFLHTSRAAVDFWDVARCLHHAFDRDGSRVQVRLRAWALESTAISRRASGKRLIEVNADLDDEERRWTWDVLAYPELDGWRARSLISRHHPHVASRTWERYTKETMQRKEKAVVHCRENGGSR